MVQTDFLHEYGTGKIFPAAGGGATLVVTASIQLSGQGCDSRKVALLMDAARAFAAERGINPDRVVPVQGAY